MKKIIYPPPYDKQFSEEKSDFGKFDFLLGYNLFTVGSGCAA
jgi:hypothetical protein